MQTSNQPDDELPDHGLCKSTKRSVSKTTDTAVDAAAAAVMTQYPRAILNAPVPPTRGRSMAPANPSTGPTMDSVLPACSPAVNTRLIADWNDAGGAVPGSDVRRRRPGNADQRGARPVRAVAELVVEHGDAAERLVRAQRRQDHGQRRRVRAGEPLVHVHADAGELVAAAGGGDVFARRRRGGQEDEQQQRRQRRGGGGGGHGVIAARCRRERALAAACRWTRML